MSHSNPIARPRPVGDAPVAPLVASAEELAKRWMMALIRDAPLEHAARLPVVALAREAPALCAEAVRALASDRELERLGRGGDLFDLARRAGQLAGADDPAAAVAAVEALRVVLWTAALAELREPSAAQVAELSGRLAHVCATIAAASAGVAPAQAIETQASAPRAEPAPEPPGEPAGALDTARGSGPAAWIGSIGRRLERYATDGQPFAVLLIEVADVDRLSHAESEQQLERLVGQVERAVSAELRPADLLTREAVGRYWLVTPETDAQGARTLAERLARAVSGSASHRGVAVGVAIGAAVCPDDGQQAATLAAHADMGVYAARAAGRPIAPVDELV